MDREFMFIHFALTCVNLVIISPTFSLKISGEKTCHPVTLPAEDNMINNLNRKKRKASLYHDISVIR